MAPGTLRSRTVGSTWAFGAGKSRDLQIGFERRFREPWSLEAGRGQKDAMLGREPRGLEPRRF